MSPWFLKCHTQRPHTESERLSMVRVWPLHLRSRTENWNTVTRHAWWVVLQRIIADRACIHWRNYLSDRWHGFSISNEILASWVVEIPLRSRLVRSCNTVVWGERRERGHAPCLNTSTAPGWTGMGSWSVGEVYWCNTERFLSFWFYSENKSCNFQLTALCI